jgi:hypothetical protein
MKPNEYEHLISKMSKLLTNDGLLSKDGHIAYGRNNKWQGITGVSYQIDVSVSNCSKILLIECKRWKSRITLDTFWAFFGKMGDIQRAYPNKDLNGAIVTTSGWSSSVRKLSRFHAGAISLYRISEYSELLQIVHTHFVKPVSIGSEERFGTPRISNV